MKAILFVFMMLASICPTPVLSCDEEKEIDLRNQTESNGIDRGNQFIAYYLPDSDIVEIYAYGISQYNAAIVDTNHQVVVSETFCTAGVLRLPAPCLCGTYTLNIVAGSSHLSGQFVVQ